MHLIYFLAGGPRSINVADLAKYGLAHINATSGIHCRETARGPGGRAGVFVASNDCPASLMTYDADSQEWQKAPAKFQGGPLEWYVGYSKAAGVPGPSELARKQQLPGKNLILADGRPWLIPMARQWVRVEDRDPPIAWSHVLPQKVKLNDEGEWIPGDVREQYRRLWDLTLKYEDLLQSISNQVAAGEIEGEVTIDGTDLVTEAMLQNYHVSAVEISLLGILDTDLIRQIVDTVRDSETFNAIANEIEAAQAKNVDRQQSQADGDGSTVAVQETETDTIPATL